MAIPRRIIDFKPEVFKKALDFVLLNTDFSGSLEIFEKRFADYIGAPFAIGVSSARKGLAVALKALGLNEGDEVILASLNYFAVPAVIQALGLKPVFVDVEKDTGNISPEAIEHKIRPGTRAIIITHMFGRACNMDKIINIVKRNKLILIEDCAQALGAEYNKKRLGTFGDAAIFSFGIGKSLMCFGGGMLVTGNARLADDMRRVIRNSGCPKKPALVKEVLKHYMAHIFSKRTAFNLSVFPLFKSVFMISGVNILDILFGEKPKAVSAPGLSMKKVSLSDFQSAVGLLQLEELDKDIELRIAKSKRLYEGLDGLNVNLKNANGRDNVYLNYKILVSDKGSLRRSLLYSGIDTQRQDIHACHKLGLADGDKADCPVSEFLDENLIGIPNYPSLRDGEIDYICERIKEHLAAA